MTGHDLECSQVALVESVSLFRHHVLTQERQEGGTVAVFPELSLQALAWRPVAERPYRVVLIIRVCFDFGELAELRLVGRRP